MAAIALDLGGTKLAGAVFAEDGTVISEHHALLGRRSGGEVGALVIASLKRLMATAPDVAAIAISVPGVAHATSGRVWAPNIGGWEDYPLCDEVRASLSREDVPVVIESDRTCSILGEAWHGAARGSRHAIFLAVGTGIGAGILTDGRVLRGARDISGAVGWLALDRPWDEKYRSCGCFEYYASGDGLARHARELLTARTEYRGPLREVAPESITAQDVFRLYETGDDVAMAVLDRAVELWGMATANLVSLFDPERVIFGGGVFGPGTRFLPDIAREAERWGQPLSMSRAELAASALGSSAALHGAGFSALRAATREGRDAP